MKNACYYVHAWRVTWHEKIYLVVSFSHSHHPLAVSFWPVDQWTATGQPRTYHRHVCYCGSTWNTLWSHYISSSHAYSNKVRHANVPIVSHGLRNTLIQMLKSRKSIRRNKQSSTLGGCNLRVWEVPRLPQDSPQNKC